MILFGKEYKDWEVEKMIYESSGPDLQRLQIAINIAKKKEALDIMNAEKDPYLKNEMKKLIYREMYDLEDIFGLK